MAPLPSIFLLVDMGDEDVISYSHSICTELALKFGLTDTSVRSSSIPIERLAQGQEQATLCVYLGAASDQGSRLISALENETSIPVLELKDPADNGALQIAKWCGLASEHVHRLVREAVAKHQQSRLVDDAQLQTKSPKYAQAIAQAYDANTQITGDDVTGEALPDRIKGKVRDRYAGATKLALVTTDRQSGFDRHLASVPYKGAVLNLTSAFWFEKTKRIVPNHLLAVPHPNVSIVKKCIPFPIEFVVRSYVTGSTSTSIWKNYQNGVRNYCGHKLPEGLTKNQKLWANLLTPTTKEEDHDRPIGPEEVVSEGWMTKEDWDVCASAALQVFALGQKVAADHGLILVDTKYEFGKDESTGEILLIDEVHTPDSSRYWLASTYEQRMREGKEPDNIDKEFLRLWFRDHCNPYEDETLPEAPRELVLELARRYILLFQLITWKDFDFDGASGEGDIGKAIENHL